MKKAKNAPRSSEEASSRVVDDELGDDLRLLVDAALKSEGAKRMTEAEHMLRLSAVACAARGRRVGSRSAMDVCAQLLNMTRQTLQPYAVIASRWDSAAELLKFFELRGAKGRSLSPSHVLELARLPRHSRDSWVGRILTEGLDARDLRRQLRGEPNAHR